MIVPEVFQRSMPKNKKDKNKKKLKKFEKISLKELYKSKNQSN
jgi:hypothetical protein